MGIIRSTFDSAGEIYSILFADWLHIHFLIRTVIILLSLWLLIYLASQFFQYIFGPLVVLFYCHIILRAYNYLFVESVQEWIYIKYYSKDKPNFYNLYLRLCDKSHRNREMIEDAAYTEIIRRGRVRKVSLQAMIICGVTATLWAGAFGLHQEYAAPAVVLVEETATTDVYQDVDAYDSTYYDNTYYAYPEETTAYQPENITPDSLLILNEQGSEGTRLRNGPGITGYTVVEILWDNAVMQYLNLSVADHDVMGMYWLRVQTAGGSIGYISNQLVEIFSESQVLS